MEPNDLTYMMTVSEYVAAAGGGRNTIRRMSDKYQHLMPGSLVHMEYGTELNENGRLTQVPVVETLEVASVVIGPYHLVVPPHAEKNHGGMNLKQLTQFFRKCYEDFHETQDFMVIYFK